MPSPNTFTLTAHGAKMPAIGFGTMEFPGRATELVAAAIAAGYRHIDTARKYGTEEQVGEGIRASGIVVAAVPRALEEAHLAEDLDVFDWSLNDEEMRRISALRSRNIRIADPPERAPKWDVETIA
jgi:diketogulonate reductase-like aldo/keto reductase